jgi:hypothetical protein
MCRKKKNVEIIFLISNIYIIEGMCEKKVQKCLHVMKKITKQLAQLFLAAQFFWQVL